VDTLLTLSVLRGQGIVNSCGNIKVSNLVPTEAPEVRMTCQTRGMVFRVSVSTSIAQPNIVSSIGEQERKSIIRSQAWPKVGAGKKTVLNESNGPLFLLVLDIVRVWNSEEADNVAIFSGHIVSLNWITMFLDEMDLQRAYI